MAPTDYVGENIVQRKEEKRCRKRASANNQNRINPSTGQIVFGQQTNRQTKKNDANENDGDVDKVDGDEIDVFKQNTLQNVRRLIVPSPLHKKKLLFIHFNANVSTRIVWCWWWCWTFLFSLVWFSFQLTCDAEK